MPDHVLGLWYVAAAVAYPAPIGACGGSALSTASLVARSDPSAVVGVPRPIQHEAAADEAVGVIAAGVGLRGLRVVAGGAGICFFSDATGFAGEFFHHDELFVLLHERFDVGHFVAGENEEPGGVLPDFGVLARRHGEGRKAFVRAAFAHDQDRRQSLTGRVERVDLLVGGAERGLVTRDPLRPPRVRLPVQEDHSSTWKRLMLSAGFGEGVAQCNKRRRAIPVECVDDHFAFKGGDGQLRTASVDGQSDAQRKLVVPTVCEPFSKRRDSPVQNLDPSQPHGPVWPRWGDRKPRDLRCRDGGSGAEFLQASRRIVEGGPAQDGPRGLAALELRGLRAHAACPRGASLGGGGSNLGAAKPFVPRTASWQTPQIA
jgi:hypothetical protein